MMNESFSQKPLTQIIPSYLYQQYADDDTLQSFVDSYNSIAQGYLDWFNNTPLAVYTNLSDSLLDWVGVNLYGISRPIIQSITNLPSTGAILTTRIGQQPINTLLSHNSGTTQTVTDDIYKRCLTWYLYKGDGNQFTMQWLRRRFARFLFGINGSDITVDQLQYVKINQMQATNNPSILSAPIITKAILVNQTTTVSFLKSQYIISVPYSQNAEICQSLFNQGFLPAPFQIKLLYTIS